MKSILLIFFLSFSVFSIISCSDNKDKSGEVGKSDSTAADSSLAYVFSEDVEYFLSLEGQVFELPLVIDSLFLRGANESASGIELKTEQVRKLAANISDHQINQNTAWGLEGFYTIDSLKTNNLYEDYLNNIDIGMIKYGDAYYLGEVKIDNENLLLIWMTIFSSYEACPFFAGTQVMGTLVHKGNIVNSALLAEEMSAGDAPVGMHRLVFCTIDTTRNGNYSTYQEDTDEDENYELVEKVTKNEFELKIENGLLTILPE